MAVVERNLTESAVRHDQRCVDAGRPPTGPERGRGAT